MHLNVYMYDCTTLDSLSTSTARDESTFRITRHPIQPISAWQEIEVGQSSFPSTVRTDSRPEYVACPICTRQIPEADINLHLDLQCPGEASTSRKASQGSNNKSSPKQEVIDILDTPPKRSSDGAGTSKGNVASIFASRKRVKLEEPAETEDTSQPTPSISERKRPLMREQAGTGMGQGMEKKPRVNPLTANQP